MRPPGNVLTIHRVVDAIRVVILVVPLQLAVDAVVAECPLIVKSHIEME